MMDDIMFLFTKSSMVVYLEKILIFSKTSVEHFHHIHQVLTPLRQHKLYANLEKFSFNMERI